MDVRHRHAIVTGGSSGIGLATAELLAARGARVSLLARDPDRLARATARLRAAGATVAARPADVTDAHGLAAALDELESAQGPCDILLHSAGAVVPGHFLDLDDATFRTMMEVNYFGTLNAMRRLAPGMVKRGHGSVVAVSSAAALVGVFGYTAYGPAKCAVRGLMEAARAELARHGVHTGLVLPPDVDTPQLAEENRHKPAETRAIAGTVKPLPPARVARAILTGIHRRRFLICPDPTTWALAHLGSAVTPVLHRVFARRIRLAAAAPRRKDPGPGGVGR